jgi:hypothetical protein
MPNIIGEPFKNYVAQQINARQKAHGSGTDGTSRTPEQITYLNSKTAWVKLASGIKVNDARVQAEGIRPGLAWGQLARNYILYGGVSSLQDGYLKQRGTYSDANNVWDYIKGTYNVSARTTDNKNTGKYGLSPMPGIIGAEIKSLNRGSIKRAEVTIKCYTPDQFQIIDLIYLRLGYTMFLEWGWAPYLDNSGKLQANYTTLIESENGFFSDKWKDKSYSAFLPAIEAYRKGKDGNYDGLLCKVVNFNWTFAQDGSYDITLSLISLGDVVESLKLNIPPSKQMSTFVNQSYALYNNEDTGDASIIPSPADNVISSYLFLQKLYLDKDNNPDGNGKSADERANVDSCDVYSTINGTRIPLAGHFIVPPKNGAISLSTITDTYNASSKADAIKWLEDHGYTTSNGYAEVENIDNSSSKNAFSLSVYDEDDVLVSVKSTPILETTDTNQNKKDVVYLNYNNGEDSTDFINDAGFYMRFGHLLEFIRNYAIPKIDGTNKPIVEIDYGKWSNLMYSVPYQVSFDPRVCIVNGGELVSRKDFFPTLEGWKNKEKGYAWIMNIYLSHNQILSSLNGNIDEKGDVALFDFLQDICNAINKAMGGVNNLEVILDEETNTLKIIDGNYTSTNVKKSYELELYGYNPTVKYSNFVRNFTLKTEITNDFATMATIGSTAGGYVKGTENTMFSKWNKGLIDRWKEKLVPGDEASREKEGEVAEPNSEYKENIWKQRLSAFGYTLLDVESWSLLDSSGDTAGLSDEIIDKNVAIATEFYKYVQPEIQKEVPKYGSPLQGFVPINLSITMDGISGIKIYNALNVSTRFLPKNYPDSLKFIIKGVNHSLKDNDWETNIETVTIAQNEE